MRDIKDPGLAANAFEHSMVINCIGARAHAIGEARDRSIAQALVEHYAEASRTARRPLEPFTIQQARNEALAIGLDTQVVHAIESSVPFAQVTNNVREYFVAPSDRTRTEATPFLSDNIALAPGDCLLDAGCSAGRYLLHHAGRGARLIGADLTGFALEMGSRAWAASQSAPQPTWLASDMLELPLEAGLCTHVTSFVVLAYVPLRAALRELNRVLKPGGMLLFTTEGPAYFHEEWSQTATFSPRRAALARWWLGSRLLDLGLDWQQRGRLSRLSSVALYSPRTLRRVLPECGFAVEKIETLRASPAGERLIGVVARKVG